MQSIEQEIKKKCKILIRLHPNDSHFSNNISFNHDIIDVTLFSDMQELILLADVLLTDYSSAIFDFMLLNKPYVRYVNDLEKYAELRGYQIHIMNCRILLLKLLKNCMTYCLKNRKF